MIYTSYFAKLKSLPEDVIPISICAKTPDWYKGLQYKKLAPKYDFFTKWKINHDNEYYIKCFNEQVLSKLNAKIVYDDFLHRCDRFPMEEPDFCLLCYEKPSEFCHRHLIADWFCNNGIECKEYNFEK